MKNNRYLGFGLAVFVSVFVADTLSRHFGHAWAFWLLGGALIGLGGTFTVVPKEKRTLSRMILAIVLTAVGASAAAFVAGAISSPPL